MSSRKYCCICKTGTSSRFYSSELFGDDLKLCFLLEGEREGHLCGSCKNCVVNFRTDNTKTFAGRVDSKGKFGGASGHRVIGGKQNCTRKLDQDNLSQTDCTAQSQTQSTSKEGTDTEAHDVTSTSKEIQLKRELDKMYEKIRVQQTEIEHQKTEIDASKNKCQKLEAEVDRFRRFEKNLKEELGIDSCSKSHQLRNSVLQHIVETSTDENVIKVVRGGRPKHYVHVPLAGVGSSNCSQRTLQRRSKIMEKIEKAVASGTISDSYDTSQSQSCSSMEMPPPPPSQTNVSDDVVAQRCANIKRQKKEYATASKSAGLKTCTQFTRETIDGIRSIMPETMWSLIKRTIEQETGINVFGTREAMRSSATLKHKYEYGNFESERGETIHFTRIVDLEQLISDTVHELEETEQIVESFHDTLWLHVSGDKGGKSTKLVLQILNGQDRHSVRSLKLLGIFEGGQDTRHNVEKAFGPVFDELLRISANIEKLHIHKPQISENLYTDEMLSSVGDSLDFTPLNELNHENKYISSKCKHCKEAIMQTKPKNEQQCPTFTHDESIYTKCRLTWGGDWEWLAKVTGLTGPNGYHFCPHCLASLNDLQKGQPHSMHVVGETKTMFTEKRNLSTCHAKAKEFTKSGAKKETAKLFDNCIQAPLIGTKGTVIEKVSVSPLHISLGLGLQLVEIVEENAKVLDKDVLENNGIHNDQINDLYLHVTDLKTEYEKFSETKQAKQQDLEAKHDQVQSIKDENQQHFEKCQGKFTNNTASARESRKRVQQLNSEIKQTGKTIDQIERNIRDNRKMQAKVQKQISDETGPFMNRFNTVLKDLGVRKQSYHGGSLIGPDINLILQVQNFTKLAEIFHPLVITCGTTADLKTFGSEQLVDKIKLMFQKFKSCYDLYTANRLLCKHEVELLAMRCSDFGSWFPINFPNANIKRKFHLLTVEVPRQARALGTIGMMTEQATESIHAYINKLERMFCTVREPAKRQKILFRQHANYSSPRIHLK